MLKRTPSSLSTMLQYPVHAENKSLYNTPPVFAIYVMRLVLAWLLKQGGLAAVDEGRISERPTRSTQRSTAPASTRGMRTRAAGRG